MQPSRCGYGVCGLLAHVQHSQYLPSASWINLDHGYPRNIPVSVGLGTESLLLSRKAVVAAAVGELWRMSRKCQVPWENLPELMCLCAPVMQPALADAQREAPRLCADTGP